METIETITKTLKKKEMEKEIINNYILPLLDPDTPLYNKISKATVLPSIVHSLLLREPLPYGIHVKVKKEIEYYNTLGYSLPPFKGNKDSDIISWYMTAVEKRKEDSLLDWIKRVAIASAIVLSDLMIQKAPREISIFAQH